MLRRSIGLAWVCGLLAAAVSAGCGGAGSPSGPESRYEALVALLRGLARLPAARARRRRSGLHRHGDVRAVPGPRAVPPAPRRPSTRRGWPIPQQVDWHLVRAEMNGLDFDHRVLQPWANNPAFYVTVFPSQSDQPAREGPLAYGAVELWSYTCPARRPSGEQIEPASAAIPALLRQAQGNLVGTGRDLWTFGTASIREQSRRSRAVRRAAAAPSMPT